MNRKLLLAAALLMFGCDGGTGGTGWEGVWKVQDTAGEPFEITIKPNGVAEGDREDQMAGVWTASDGTLHLSWYSGWKGVIEKKDDGYVKKAYAPGVRFSEEPSNTSPAERVK